MLLQEVHHRVKNNLQVISSLLKLHGERIEDPAAKDAFSDSQSRVAAIGVLHEKLCQSKNLGQVSLAEYGEGIMQALLRTHGTGARARVRVEASGAALPIDMAVPCGLLLNELTTNALKHAFRGALTESPEINVAMAVEGVHLVLSVRDNGVGLPADFDLAKCRTLGMHLVRTLARQIHAEITTSKEGGTRWSLRIPLGQRGQA
jgi:two-component sensor histidine kinase